MRSLIHIDWTEVTDLGDITLGQLVQSSLLLFTDRTFLTKSLILGVSLLSYRIFLAWLFKPVASKFAWPAPRVSFAPLWLWERS